MTSQLQLGAGAVGANQQPTEQSIIRSLPNSIRMRMGS
jgi:hypothetical protein